jgi:hypothetical protein
MAILSQQVLYEDLFKDKIDTKRWYSKLFDLLKKVLKVR